MPTDWFRSLPDLRLTTRFLPFSTGASFLLASSEPPSFAFAAIRGGFSSLSLSALFGSRVYDSAPLLLRCQNTHAAQMRSVFVVLNQKKIIKNRLEVSKSDRLLVLRKCAVIGLFFLCAPLFGDLIESAQNLEREGRHSEAIVRYGRWLADNGKHPDASAVLLHASSLFEDPLETISFLSKYVHLFPDDRRGEIFARMAELEVIIGLPGFALEHFTLAVKFGGSHVETWRLQSLILRFSMGEDVYAEAVELKETARDWGIVSESGLLAAMLLAREEGPRRGIAEIFSLIEDGFILPATWLELIRLQAGIGDREGAEESLRNLERDFPGSVYLYVAQSRILEWVSPSTLMEPRMRSEPSSVQIGAFERRDHAARMRERLENDGFTAWLESMDNLWRVIVHDPDGRVKERLAAKGYGSSSIAR